MILIKINERILLRFLTLCLVVLCLSCQTNSPIDIHQIIPLPQEITFQQGSFQIKSSTELIVADKSIAPLANLFNKHLRTYAGFTLKIKESPTSRDHIILKYDKEQKDESYSISIDENISVVAADYQGLAWGVSSLIQLVDNEQASFKLPKLNLQDAPEYAYRAVMLDVARFWHPVESIKSTIDLLWFYKIKYLGLHLSDNRRCTFPFKQFPKLQVYQEDGTPFFYTIKEMDDLVAYAKDRGVTIIPEIDMPGHSAPFWRLYPEEFGSVDETTGEAQSLYVVNMAKESTYGGVEVLINQLAETFYNSPYINVGGDEVYLEVLKEVKEYENYCKKHGLELALIGEADELFCHFLVHLNNMVKANGKHSLIWEGFKDTGAGSVTIPDDMTVIVWNTTYNRPDSLINKGYKIINSTWLPLYIVGAMNLALPPEQVYDWEVTDWAHWNEDIEDIKVAKNESTYGGQISFWEQKHYQVIPLLEDRVPAFAERLWNNNNEDSYIEFHKRSIFSKQKFKSLMHPIEFHEEGLLHDKDKTFVDNIQVTLNSQTPGDLKFYFSSSWKLPLQYDLIDYNAPIDIDDSGILSVLLVDDQGAPIGLPTQRYYQKTRPCYRYKVVGPAPSKGWNKMPDIENLKVIRSGLSGKMTPQRLDKINGELFAKVKTEGHINTRFQGIYNPYALELNGKINIEFSGTYSLQIQTWDGLATLSIDQRKFEGKSFENKAESFNVDLEKGVHDFTIHYFYKNIQNQLSIMVKLPDTESFIPFESLLIPIAKNEF